ncbi:MAG TPA: hypothetical protein VKR06_08575 [Ktedonosporobacter sp.]|nr:hypothetical protein [Ktedonosporobacter sp.]
MTSEQIEPATVISQQKRHYLFLWLLALACLFELLYLLLLALSPLPGLHLSDSPLVKALPWTLIPSQVLTSVIGPFIQNGPVRIWFPSLLLGLTFLGLAGIYTLAILAVLRLPPTNKTARYWLFLLLGASLFFGLTLLLQPLLLSDDVFTYIFSGRILAIYHADPMNTAPKQFPADPYLRWVILGRNTPNIFGTLWLWVSSRLAILSASPWVTLLLFKGLELLAHLVNGALVWSILDRIAPDRRVPGTLLYLWNPLALIELAGSGHNEGFLLCLLLVATWLYVLKFRGSFLWRWCCEIGALLVFGLAISTNLITLLLVPLLIWFEVRSQQGVFHIIWNSSWRALVMLVPALLILFQFWHGSYTFFALTSAMDMDHFVHSPVGLLSVPLRALYQTVATDWKVPSIIAPTVAADVTLRASATFIFILIYSHLFSQVRSVPALLSPPRKQPGMEAGLDILLKSWGVAIFWYMILVSGWFWPWYLLWMLWIIVLQRLDAFNSAMLVLSCTALFIYPFVGFTRTQIASYQTALIFGVPLAYLIIAWSKQKRAERTTTSYD